MANDINKKIAIDVQVNSDGKEQIEQYKAAFDSLRTAISGLSKPLTDLSKNISSLNKDISQLASTTEKQAAKIVAATKKASTEQTKINAASTRSLKENLSATAKLNDEAMQKLILRKYHDYQAQASIESEEYNNKKEMLDALLTYKEITQQEHDTEAEKLTKQHYDNIRAIMDGFIAESNGKQEELTAASITKIKIDSTEMGKQAVEQFQLAVSTKPKKNVFTWLEGAAKTTFSNIFSYYKGKQKDQSKAVLTADAKTNAQIVANAKATDDKKRQSAIDSAQKIADATFTILTKSIAAKSTAEVNALETKKNAELNNASLTAADKQNITTRYQNKELPIKQKAFRDTQKVSVAQAVINGAIAVTKAEAELGPVAGTIALGAIIAQTAAQIATIVKQQPPQMAKGGYFKSDGKGSLLSGYNRQDDTNAYLRSGEAVVVSEAMRVPWARNLVSAINVGFGGRDFSIKNAGKGYAVGGIFTDGGDANRYYNQPVNDQKNLANTIAYQMINNFPPVYVDVKDVNNQQNILAQTINRVNL